MTNETHQAFQPYDQRTFAAPMDRQSDSTLENVQVNEGLATLRADLQAITSTSDNMDQAIVSFINLAVSRSTLLGAAWYQQPVGVDPELWAAQFSNPALDNPSILGQLLDAGRETLEKQQPQVFKTDRIRNATVICVPFSINEKVAGVVCGIVHDSRHNRVQAMLVCQAIVTHFEQWRDNEELTEMAFELRSSAAVLELLGKVHQCDSTQMACITIAQQLQSHLRCDYVAVGLKQNAGCRLAAISSVADFDENSTVTGLFRAAFDEAMVRASYTAFPPRSNAQRNATLAHRKLAQQMRTEAAITIPLRNDQDEIIGAIAFLGHRQLDRNASTRNLIRALEHPLGGGIEMVKYAEGGWLRRVGRILVSREKTSLKWALVAVGLITLIAMFIPVPYRIHCKCTAEPVRRSVSVAPFDGLLQDTRVEPGDIVSAGQTLAIMDGREIRFEKAGVVADRNRAIKQRDTHMANHEVPEAMMADLESMQLEMKRRVLEDRENNLEIASNVDGIVLTGSIDQRENFPVSRGQLLYEIAPLDELKIELAVPADEVLHVKIGQPVKFRLDGFGTENLDGTVCRIRPSSTIRDEQNVFVAEVILDNRLGFVRPGMKGTARIHAEHQRLGWTIFHRPWERFISAIGL